MSLLKSLLITKKR